jgi:hypothetical protein
MIASKNNKESNQPSSPSIPTSSKSRLANDMRTRKNKIISALISLHAIRIIGISFLIGTSQGILSPVFGYTAGIGDILIGLTAIPIAYYFKRAYRLATNVSIIWNLLGIIDLVTAIYLGITSSNVRLLSAGGHHPTMTTMPWVLIPTVGVPILLTIHVITLWLLRKK